MVNPNETGAFKEILEVQENGSGGGNWKLLGYYGKDAVSTVIVGEVTGGGQGYTVQRGRSARKGGALVPVGVVADGVPEDITYDIQVPSYAFDAIADLQGRKNIRIRKMVGDPNDKTLYNSIDLLVGCFSTSAGDDSRAQSNNQENLSDIALRTYSQLAMERVDIQQVRASLISGTVTTLAINEVRSFGYMREAGIRGEVRNNDGNQEYAFVTDQDGSDLPHLFYTLNGGTTWTDVTLTGMTDGDAVDLCWRGGYVYVAMINTGGGVCYAKWSDVLAGTPTWARVTGISTGTICNAIHSIGNQVIYVGADNGVVYRSGADDGSFVFTTFNNGVVTTEDILCIDSYGESLVWFGCTTGVLLKLENGALSINAITGSPTSAINSLAVPDGRGTEVVLGLANGTLRRTINTGQTFTQPRFNGDAAGSIACVRFSGSDGAMLWILQTNATPQTRILLDMSGGNCGDDVITVASYTSPDNDVINSIAPSDYNYAVAVGEVSNTYGYIGRIAPAVA